MPHHRDEPEGLVGPECQEICSQLGPTIDWELWEGFLQGMGVWPGLLLPGLRLQHSWGSKEGRGQRKRQELGQTPPTQGTDAPESQADLVKLTCTGEA